MSNRWPKCRLELWLCGWSAAARQDRAAQPSQCNIRELAPPHLCFVRPKLIKIILESTKFYLDFIESDSQFFGKTHIVWATWLDRLDHLRLRRLTRCLNPPSQPCDEIRSINFFLPTPASKHLNSTRYLVDQELKTCQGLRRRPDYVGYLSQAPYNLQSWNASASTVACVLTPTAVVSLFSERLHSSTTLFIRSETWYRYDTVNSSPQPCFL